MGEELLNFGTFESYEEVIKLSQKHLEKVYETVTALRETVETAFSKKPGYKEKLRKLNIMEREADKIHESLVLRLAEGDLDPNDREDLLEFSKITDLVADWSRDAGRILNIIVEDLEKINNKLKKGIIKMLNSLEKEVKLVKLVLELLRKNTKERAVKTSLKVSEIEQLVDQLNLYNLALLKELKSLPTATIILTRDLINCIEQAADYAKDSSDLIRTIAIKKI